MTDHDDDLDAVHRLFGTDDVDPDAQPTRPDLRVPVEGGNPTPEPTTDRDARQTARLLFGYDA